MSKVLVIGYGNTLRGDDGIGYIAALELDARYADSEVHVIAAHQLYPEMAEVISHYDRVIFMDAAPGDVAGQVHFYVLTPAAGSQGALTHHSTPQQLLLSARDLYDGQGQGVLFTISGEAFGYDEELSPAVQKVLPVLLESVHQLIECYRTDDSCLGLSL